MRHKRLKIVFLAVWVITACGQSDSSAEFISKNTSQAVERSIGTNGTLIPIQSDNVAAAGYEEINQTMIVQFHGGEIYEYYGVQPEVWLDFVQAQPHPWSQVGKPKLVDAGIPYQRIS
jgi:hypothetical protein